MELEKSSKWILYFTLFFNKTKQGINYWKNIYNRIANEQIRRFLIIGIMCIKDY